MHKIKSVILAAAMAAAPASAAMVSFDFSGVYDQGDIIGQKYSGTVTYDSAQDFTGASTSPDFSSADYSNAFKLSNLINLTDGGRNDIFVSDTRNARDRDRVTFRSVSNQRGNVSGFALIFVGTSSALSSTRLPTLDTLPDASRYLQELTPAGQTRFGTLVLAPVAAVPEPAAWAMMIGGFGAVGAAMRRRRTAIAFA